MKLQRIIIIGVMVAFVSHLYAQGEIENDEWDSSFSVYDNQEELRSNSIINNTGFVGSPNGTFSVSSTGAATYSIPIEVPKGVNGTEPQLTIMYNSQAGNGIAGWGCNVSGVSAITRGPRDIYHDGHAEGMDHTMNDAFYLDGQRLIERERIIGADSVVFCLENNPYTRVVLHGLNGSSQLSTWFSMETPEGMVYEYGKTTGQQSYTAGTSKVNAWYVTKAQTSTGNAIRYSYTSNNYYVYLDQIIYGSLLTLYVDFEYEDRPDAMEFSLEGVRGCMSKRLKSVTSRSGSQVYRKYTLSYNQTGDGTTTKYSRLISVTEANGNNQELNPITFAWDYPGSFNTQPSLPNLSLVSSTQLVTFDDFNLMTADFNGDGVSDVIQHASVRVPNGNNGLSYYNDYYFFCSSVANDGTVTYPVFPCQLRLSPDTSAGEDWYDHVNMPVVTDIDGDGLHDVIIPYMLQGPNNGVTFYYVMGKDIIQGNAPSYHSILYILQHSTENPLYTSDDFDQDGRADLLLLEKVGVSGSYDCRIYKGGANSFEVVGNTTLPLNFIPKKLYASDFNGNGMPDILVIGQNGYKIFWNTGNGLTTASFSENASTVGTTLTDAYMMQMGDFNGDGLPDLLSNDTNDNRWFFLTSKGDGSFTKTQACQIEAYEQGGTNKDNGYFTCQVFDIDGDGKSDAVISKAMFSRHHDIVGTYYRFEKTKTFWMMSNGNTLTQHSAATSNRKEDARLGHYMVGDFNSDGLGELLHYGYNCYNAVNADVNPSLFAFYKTGHHPYLGKVNAIVNGYGTQTSISYDVLTNKTIYSKTENSNYPVLTLWPKFVAVSSVTNGNGAAGSISCSYHYKNFKWCHQGRGSLGFSSTTLTNHTLGTVTETEITRDSQTLLPVETYEIEILGGDTSIVTKNYKAAFLQGTKAVYYSLLSCVTTDLDGNTTTMTYTNDSICNNVPLTINEYGFDGTEKSTIYGNYVKRGNQYLPSCITTRSYHPDDCQDYNNITRFTYDAKGLVATEIRNADTSLALTTAYTYDTRGNVLTTTTTGNDVETVTKICWYDVTDRFVTYTQERGFIVKNYTYDTWGNVLTETDNTRSACPQTTIYTYDGWGNLTSATSPVGLVTNYSLGWGNAANKRYYTLVEPMAAPWVKTWYDETGREVLVESIGQKSVTIKNETNYNSRGLVARKAATEGNRLAMHVYSYDSRNRITVDKLFAAGSNLSQTAYSYDSHTVTAVKAGRSYTSTYDSWGNLTQATDPVSSVSYSYTSSSNPASVTSEGSTVSMQYDRAGNRTQLSDPDAGTMTYTYDALGRIKTQTDGNGNVTTNTYNSRGQLVQQIIGNVATCYTYGTGTSNNGLLLSVSRNGYSTAYQYDNFGRVTQETRNYVDGGTRTMYFVYNQLGQLASRSFPNQLTVSFQYDSIGNLYRMYSGTSLLYEVKGFNGKTLTEGLGTLLTRTKVYDDLGLLKSAVTNTNDPSSTSIAPQQYTYNYATGNLTSRTVKTSTTETFYYDSMDRLTEVFVPGSSSDLFTYANNGNITHVNYLGSYQYNGTKPHAVTGIAFPYDPEPSMSSSLHVYYNNHSKPYYIEDEESMKDVYFSYGPDLERWESSEGLYFGDYEERFNWLSPNNRYGYTYLGRGVLCVTSPSGLNTFYYIHTDNLGSVIEIVEEDGTSVFSASYDAWGKQTISRNDINFYRGYTGHEMLNDFGLINMNGRLYDPLIARFLSPDNYVQQPFNSQNFNRYSYCLNNPLKYVDPDGELFGLLVSATINLVKNIIENNVHIGKYFNSSKWDMTYKAWKIDIAPFKGNIGRVLSNLTWGVNNTMIGNRIAHFTNIVGLADDVTDMEGMTAIGGVTPNKRFFTIGPYSFGPKNYKATWKDHTFVHEYGHYLQHTLFGPLYIPIIAIPSLTSAAGIAENIDHHYRWFEVDANKRAVSYFDKHYGRGKAVYGVYFDKNAFQTPRMASIYMNPRTKDYNYARYYPISNCIYHWTDFIIPLTIMSFSHTL